MEICLHPSYPSVEWIEIFLWSYEIYQGTIGAVLILKMFYSSGRKSDIRALNVLHSSQLTSETMRKVFIHTSHQNNVTMDDPVSSKGKITDSFGHVELNVSEYQTDYSNKCICRSDVTEYSTNPAGDKSRFCNR